MSDIGDDENSTPNLVTVYGGRNAMSDIVERLLNPELTAYQSLRREAADEIERLRGQVLVLEMALRAAHKNQEPLIFPNSPNHERDQ